MNADTYRKPISVLDLVGWTKPDQDRRVREVLRSIRANQWHATEWRR